MTSSFWRRPAPRMPSSGTRRSLFSYNLYVILLQFLRYSLAISTLFTRNLYVIHSQPLRYSLATSTLSLLDFAYHPSSPLFLYAFASRPRSPSFNSLVFYPFPSWMQPVKPTSRAITFPNAKNGRRKGNFLTLQLLLFQFLPFLSAKSAEGKVIWPKVLFLGLEYYLSIRQKQRKER